MKNFWKAVALLTFMTVLSFLIDSPVHESMSALRSPALDQLMFFFTALGGLTIGLPFIIIVLLLLEYKHKGKLAANFIAALVIDIIITTVLKLAVGRDRPSGTKDPTDFTEAYMSSFPSGHASRAFTMFNTLNHYYRFPLVFYSIAVLVAFSRVYFGVHYLSDVMTGVVIGLVVSHEVCTRDLGLKIVKRLKAEIR